MDSGDSMQFSRKEFWNKSYTVPGNPPGNPVPGNPLSPEIRILSPEIPEIQLIDNIENCVNGAPTNVV